MVIVKLDIYNGCGSLCVILVLDVLSGKSSRDYPCGIKRFDHQESHLEVTTVLTKTATVSHLKLNLPHNHT